MSQAMNIQRINLTRSMYCLLLFSRFADATDVPSACKLGQDGKLVECSNLCQFPNGSFDKVETIHFSENNFTSLGRFVLYNNGFRHPKTINLRHNHIKHIQSKAFAMMSSILHLDLYGNSLTGFTKNTFSGLTSLKTLNLGHNHITSIQPEILAPMKFLDQLDLSYNSITNVPTNFLKDVSVTHLDLANNPISFPEDGPILESPFLSQLFLQSCNLETLPKEAFSKLPKLQNLDLSQNRLKAIPGGLFDPLVDLKYLNVGNNLITHLEAGLFSANTKLQEFLCVGNPLETEKNCEYFLPTTSKFSGSTGKPQPTSPQEQNENKASTNFTDQNWLDSHLETDSREATNDTEKHEKEEKDAENILLILILTTAIICVILLLVLIVQVCYIWCPRNRNRNVESRVYESVNYRAQT